MPKYKFTEIAINSTEKKKPTEADKDTYIGLEHLDSGTLTVSRWGADVAPIGEKLIMKKGDVLFGKRRAYQKKVGIAPFDGIFSAHGMVLRPRENVITKEYFPLFISSDYFLNEAIRISVGSLSPTVNWKDLKELEFFIPTIEEQRRITPLVWAAIKTKNAYKTLISRTDDLVKSQFIEMFYGREYPMRTIGQVVDRTVLRASKKFAKDDIIEYLDISSIDNSSKTVTGTTTYTLSEAPSRAQYVLQKDDILYSTVRPNLQNIAVNPYSANNIIGSTGFCVLRCREVSKGFMWGLITSDQFTDKMVSLASGANYPAVTDKVVYEFDFPMPPYEEQMRFERLVEQSDKSKFVVSNRNLSRCLEIRLLTVKDGQHSQ